MHESRHYGVRKGSKRPKLKETVLPPERMSEKEVQDAYDELVEKHRRLARAAARFVNNYHISPGDPIPHELIDMRSRMRDLEHQMAALADNYRGILR